MNIFETADRCSAWRDQVTGRLSILVDTVVGDDGFKFILFDQGFKKRVEIVKDKWKSVVSVEWDNIDLHFQKFGIAEMVKIFVFSKKKEKVFDAERFYFNFRLV